MYENTVRSLLESVTMMEMSNCFSAQWKSVNQLSIYEYTADQRQNLDNEARLKLPHLMIQTAQEHSMQYRYWKQDDYKKKISMFHKNVSDYKTNSWQKRFSSIQSSTQVNKDVKIRINNF